MTLKWLRRLWSGGGSIPQLSQLQLATDQIDSGLVLGLNYLHS